MTRLALSLEQVKASTTRYLRKKIERMNEGLKVWEWIQFERILNIEFEQVV